MKEGRSAETQLSKNRLSAWLVSGLLLVSLLLLEWAAPTWSDRTEGWTIDARFAFRGAEAPQSNIVILALDETSFRMMGNLQGENIRTWPRSRWAELVRTVSAGEPRLIALDVVFDTPGWDEGGDEALAEALTEAGNVVLAAGLEQSSETGHAVAELNRPVSPLAERAVGMGIAGLPADRDAGIRAFNAFYRWGTGDYPSFPLTVASLAEGRIPFSEQDLRVTGGRFPIHFRGPEGTFETIPLYQVMSKELVDAGLIDADEAVDPRVFEDAIVMVGYTTLLEGDRFLTPFVDERGMPGVEIHANAVDTLLAGDWLVAPPEWLSFALMAALGLLAAGAVRVRRPAIGLGLVVGLLLLYVAVCGFLFAAVDLVLPAVAPLVSTIVVGTGALAERMVVAERQKRRLRRRFAGVMSPERLQSVLDNWETLLQSERPQKGAAVLFADVRGFTNATETLMRTERVPEMVRFLTAYLDAMTDAVFDEGGVIYDVVGDGLMILFGLPEPFPDYALRATQAAFRMARATEELQSVWPLRDERPLRMGIGVHCGSVIDAVVGRGRRVEYSVIGDPVNTAARIESHCKVAMEIPRQANGEVPETVTILLSAQVYDRVSDSVRVDKTIPPFGARGKSEVLHVVRLLGMEEGDRIEKGSAHGK